VHYINKAVRQSTLAGLYRTARIGLVTPLRDGMNLVAKEYVAAQAADDPGVLILSQFAGAAEELKAALIVNPHDIDATAAAISRAFEMPIQERRERWNEMMTVLQSNSIDNWLAHFLQALNSDDTTGAARLIAPGPGVAEGEQAGRAGTQLPAA
jgi:trehalose 6-phosphate synthase